MKKIITLTGPSCSGKTTLLRDLTSHKKRKFKEIISTTTRPKRENEINGVDYNFVSKEDFNRIPMMEVIEFNDQLYGATVQEFEGAFRHGQVPIIVALPDGVRQIVESASERNWEVLSIYIDGDYEILHERFLERFSQENYNINVMKYYAKRLSSLVEEKSDWYTELKQYNSNVYYINNYMKDNENEVQQIILDMV